MEDLRQPAPQSRARGVDAPVAAGLDGLVAAWFWTLSVIGIILIPPLFASLLEMFQKPGDVLLGQHLTAISPLG
jgi:hypothetical protein